MLLHLETRHLRHVRVEQQTIRRRGSPLERVDELLAGWIDSRPQAKRFAQSAQDDANRRFIVHNRDTDLWLHVWIEAHRRGAGGRRSISRTADRLAGVIR